MSIPIPDSFALLAPRPDCAAVGYGAFRRAAHPPAGELAFYVNDFDLGAPEPWIVPEHSRVFGSVAEAAEAFGFGALEPPAALWGEPDEPGFRRVFAEIQARLGSGGASKIVPCAGQPGALAGGALPALLPRLAGIPAAVFPYAYWERGSGFLGATPERLFSLAGHRLETMALAGTAPRDRADAFRRDPKEIGEHEFVADTLVRRLSPLGDVARAPRQMLDLGAAVHFHTRIDVALDAEPPVGELIARLHPTPAVGAVPRSAEAMAALHAHRAALGCPAAFGAPFGVMLPGGEFHGIVLIRGVFWRDGGVGLTLPAGCGIVAESDPDREWAELALKRRMVRGWLGL